AGIQLPARTNELYPMLAIQHFPLALGIAFILGITAAAYASSDSALAALTTSFCVDFLGFKQTDEETPARTRTRMLVHLGFSLLICARSEEHTSELQSRENLVCRLLLE